MLAVRFRNHVTAVVSLALIALVALAVGWWLSPARGVEHSTVCTVALSGESCPVITHLIP